MRAFMMRVLCVFVRLGSYLIPPIGGYLFEPVAFFNLLGRLVAH